MKFDFKWFTTLPGIFITVGVILLVIALIILIVTGKKSKKAKINMDESTGDVQSVPQDMNAQAVPMMSPTAAPVSTDMASFNAMPVSTESSVDSNIAGAMPIESAAVAPMATVVDPSVNLAIPMVTDMVSSMPMTDSNNVSQSVNDISIPAMPVSGSPYDQNMVAASVSSVDSTATTVPSVSNDPFAVGDSTQVPIVNNPEQFSQTISPEPVVQNAAVPMQVGNLVPVVNPESVVSPAPVVSPEPVVSPVSVVNAEPVVNPAPVVNQVPAVVQEPIINSDSVVAPNVAVAPVDGSYMAAAQVNNVDSVPVNSNSAVASVVPVPQNVVPVVNNIQPAPVIYGGVNPTANLSGVNLNGNQSHQIYGGADPLENTQPIPGVQTVQPVQPVMTAPEMIPNPVQQ